MQEGKMNIGVIGGGSWATALVKILQDNALDKQVYWWMRNPETVAYIQKYQHNPSYLSSVAINTEMVLCLSNVEAVFEKCDRILLVTPSAFVAEALQELNPLHFKGKHILSGIKGVIPESREIIGEYLPRKFGLNSEQITVITGPCHAEEVALERLSYLTVASQNETEMKRNASLLNTRYIKTIESDDIYGTEYAAVLKNIYAIASGICHGCGSGDNFQAVLVSNAIREIKRFIDAVHPIERDINQSAYLGDLLVTAYSQFSRNRMFGNMLGKGYSVKAAQMEMNMVAEGYYATHLVYEMNQELGLFMPILDFVNAVVHEGQKPHKLLPELQNQLS